MRFLIALLVLALPLQANAADLFVKKPTSEGAPPSTIYQPANPAPAAPKVETPATATPAPPPQETIKDLAARYYRNCMTKQDTVLKNENQQMLCTCTSQKMMDEMTPADVKTMTEKTPEGQFQRNRMLLKVYAPCMEYPARALLVANCLADQNVKKIVSNFESVCNCMGDGMAKYIGANGPAVIAQSLQRDPSAQNQNPLAALMESPDFKARAQTELATCLTAGTPIAPAQ